jgi:hypothetical protein
MTKISNHDGDESKRGRGRPPTSRDFRIVPIPHAKPDAKKLGRAFLALALHQAAQAEAGEEQQKESGDESA